MACAALLAFAHRNPGIDEIGGNSIVRKPPRELRVGDQLHDECGNTSDPLLVKTTKLRMASKGRRSRRATRRNGPI